MFIKYEDTGDMVLKNVPDSQPWELRWKMFDENCADDGGLYLILDGRETLLLDTDRWCQGRPSLPDGAVGDLYRDLVEAAAKKLAADPALRLLDLDAIEDELLSSQYAERWIAKGYVTPDENGTW